MLEFFFILLSIYCFSRCVFFKFQVKCISSYFVFQSCAIPLFELEVLEKSDTKESKGIFLISQNKDTPMIYEVVCNTNSERETWIREIKSASKKCLPEYEMQPQESNKEERRQMMKGSNKIRKIIGML